MNRHGWLASAVLFPFAAVATDGQSDAAVSDAAAVTEATQVAGDAPAEAPATTDPAPAPEASTAGGENPPAEAVAADAGSTPETIPVDGAAEASAEEPKPESGNRFMQEIIVTAQKREENLQDVPISVQAFSADLLDARGIVDQSSLQQITPGLDIGTQVGYTTVFLRGVGTDAFLTADPSVATYIDGIYYPFAQSLVQAFGAVERVEVLKGPQGTLFGRNAVGGALSIITKNPSFSGPEVSLQTSYANFDDLQTRAYVNVPVTDTFAIGVSALYNSADYYIDGTAGGRPLPKEVSKGARFKARWAPLDELDIVLSYFRLGITGVGSIFQPNANPSLLGELLGIQAQDGYHGDVDAPSYTDVDNNVKYGQITYNAPGFDVKLIGSDQYINAAGCYDFDGSTLPLAQFCPPHQIADIQTGELQFVSTKDGWTPDWLQWIVGGYYFKGHQGFDPIYVTVGGLAGLAGPLSLLEQTGVTLPDGARDNLDQLLALAGPAGELSAQATTDTKSKAAFFQGTIAFTDWLSLTLGGRFQRETRSIGDSTVGLHNPDGSSTVLIRWPNARDQDGNRIGLTDTTKSFRPKVSLELRPFDGDMLVYASYQEAIKSATYNTLGLYLPPSYVKPEEMEAYEIGVKGSLFDGSTRYSAAAFWYDITNLQTQFISLLKGGAIAFENAKGARSRGVDFDTMTQLFPSLVDDLVFTLSGAYIDAVYTDFPDGSGYAEGTGLFTPNQDFTGNRVSRSPKWTLTSSLSKTWNISSGSIELSGDVYYNDGFYYAASNTTASEQKSYSLLGARASYLFDAWGLRISLFGKNLTDKKYAAGNLPTDFGNQYTLAPPRTYGVRLNWDF